MRVAIIGCGITGMSAGIALQKAGIDTVIYEKNDRPGGVIALYKKDILINNALEFVYGAAGGTFANDMWQSLGMFREAPKLKNRFNTFVWDEYSVSIYKDFEKTVNELTAISPPDKKRILRLAKSVEKFRKIEIPLITGVSRNAFSRLLRLAFSCCAAVPDVLYYGTRSFKKYSEKIEGQALKEFFAHVLNSKRSALQYLALWSFFSSGNFSIPDNNQKEMVETLYSSYISSGGTVSFDSSLLSVTVKNKRLCELHFAEKSVSDFDFVVFSNDIAAVNKILNNSGIKLPTLEKTIKNEHITSSCMLYYTLNRGDVCSITDNLAIPCDPIRVGSRWLNEFSVRIQQDTECEAAAISVTLYQNEEDFREWKRLRDEDTEQYKKAKTEIARSVATAIGERFPQAYGKLKLCDMTTPLTYERYTGVSNGGWMPESWNPLVYLRCGRGSMPGIKNASMAGQKLLPIGGTTIGAFSGVKLSEKIIKRVKRKS